VSWVARADMVGFAWQPAEDQAVKDFVKELTGDELAPVGNTDIAWLELGRRWKEIGEAKGFQTNRKTSAMYERHWLLRKKAGRQDSLSNGGVYTWSEDEVEELFRFVKEHKGDEMAVCSEGAFKELENVWHTKGYGTSRTAHAMYYRHRVQRLKRAEQSTSSTKSSAAAAPSSKSSSRKRTALPSSAKAKKSKKTKKSRPPSASASATRSPPPPPASALSTKTLASDSAAASLLMSFSSA